MFLHKFKVFNNSISTVQTSFPLFQKCDESLTFYLIIGIFGLYLAVPRVVTQSKSKTQ